MNRSLNPYLLPEGNVQIAFSGGRTSAYMLHHILEANGGLPERVEVTFQNTGREMPHTLDFVAEVGRRWGILITWLEYRTEAPFFEIVGRQGASENGEPMTALIRRRKFLPNQNSRFCTTELKIRTAKRYLRSLGWDYWTNCIGIRKDEPSRIRPEGVRDKERWTVWQPLVHANVSKRDVAEFWRAQPFDLDLPNVNGNCWLGNCDGCFLKSEANVAAFIRDFPDRAEYWEDQERWVASMWHSLTRWQRLRRIVTSDPSIAGKLREAYGKPIRPSVIKMMVDSPRSAAQWSKRYSRRELRDFMERQGDWALSTEGALCQANDGECTG